MEIRYYKNALELLKEIGLNASVKYFEKKSKEDGFEILKEAMFTAPDVSNQEINWVIRNIEIRYFPEKLEKFNISKPKPISRITRPLKVPSLNNAILKTQDLLNTGKINQSLFEELSIKIGASLGNKANGESEFTEALLDAKIKQKEVARELINRLKMLKEIKPYRVGLGLVLSGEVTQLEVTADKKNNSKIIKPHVDEIDKIFGDFYKEYKDTDEAFYALKDKIKEMGFDPAEYFTTDTPQNYARSRNKRIKKKLEKGTNVPK